jgi:hypothetical protein
MPATTRSAKSTTPTALGHSFTLDKETKRFAKFVPSQGDEALGAIYVPINDWKAIGSPATVLVSVEPWPGE